MARARVHNEKHVLEQAAQEGMMDLLGAGARRMRRATSGSSSSASTSALR